MSGLFMKMVQVYVGAPVIARLVTGQGSMLMFFFTCLVGFVCLCVREEERTLWYDDDRKKIFV